MHNSLTETQMERYKEFQDFATSLVEPYANQWDIDEALSPDIIAECAARGYMGGMIPRQYGGQEWDCVTYGLLNEAVGRSSASLTALFNVHTMVAQTLLKWGTEQQKEKWMARLAEGSILGAFALTEPGAGSDIQGITSEYKPEGDGFVLNGTKRWITCGGLADIFIVFGKLNGKPTACIVERAQPGVTVIPVNNMLGFKAGHLAVLEFRNCIVPRDNMIGHEGIAFNYIAPYALEFGRISVAWAAVGLLRGCLENSGAHALRRRTFDRFLAEHSIISKYITDMGVELEAAKLLCLDACRLKDEGLPEATERIMAAKYYASAASARHSAHAVQIMGAIGCNEHFSVSRYYRDSKTFEIIEGSSEISQMILGKSYARKAKKLKRLN
ncbi:acyl-CoA dehydrogenase family protein [Paenibacillus tritici]|uniref:acyl-CoA dehydrogenase family protein n=1 Tax=Paenibacillus tritici TaxID=1873425 RepID=UPI001BA90D5A|nr:acyl-CoA dehydrogenase family protein [Paenibacillus tritici]QUL52229.1 acyl-CoA dehydrogenase family protein [Paenibacillus tritici]